MVSNITLSQSAVVHYRCCIRPPPPHRYSPYHLLSHLIALLLKMSRSLKYIQSRIQIMAMTSPGKVRIPVFKFLARVLVHKAPSD